MAELVATRATCKRRAVGCVLVDENNHVLSTGYNGVAKGLPHCNEVTTVLPVSKPEHWQRDKVLLYGHACPGADSPSGIDLHLCQAIHAEQNALVQCRDVSKVRTVYCTASPCVSCMRLILGTGAKHIVFRKEYPHVESRQLAERAHISWAGSSGL